MTDIVIIAAMEREVLPLVRDWERFELAAPLRTRPGFRNRSAVVVCAGIGRTPATAAAKAAISSFAPKLVISAGLAGALVEGWRVGATLIPETVINAESGESYKTHHGKGTLVTSGQVTGESDKRQLAAQHYAQLVDMEAAAVAQVAREQSIPFLAVKAVSDELAFKMPPLNRFISANGELQLARFALAAAIHPSWWPKLATLKRNSEIAANALCEVLRALIRSPQTLEEQLSTRELQTVAVPKAL